MSRTLLVYSMLSLLLAGCSKSLQGLVYQRGTVPSEFHYPHVQYGHIEKVTVLNEGEKEGLERVESKETNDASIQQGARGRLQDPRYSEKANVTENIPNPLLTKEDKRDEHSPHTLSSSETVENMKRIRELGVYNFDCVKNDKQQSECTYVSEASSPNQSVSHSQLVRLQVRLDNGKDYWFKQPVNANWNPQPSDRVKVFFSEEPSASTSHALKAQLAVPAPQKTSGK